MGIRFTILVLLLLTSCSNKIKYTGTHLKGVDKNGILPTL